jgi:hypothetical protein
VVGERHIADSPLPGEPATHLARVPWSRLVTARGHVVLLLVLLAPVVALVTVLFLGRVEERLAEEPEESSRRPDPTTHPSA